MQVDVANGSYYLRVETSALKVLLARTSGPFGSPDIAAALGEGVRRWGLLVQTRAVFNVTGHVVIYDGQVFRVMVRTGALRSSIDMQWPFQTAFQARVFVNGTVTNPGEISGARARPRPVSDYAMAIELGHDEIDLKKTMRGKTVPFFGAKAAKARGPYNAVGLKPAIEGDEGYGSRWTSEQKNRELASKGHGPMLFEKKGGTTGQKGGASTYFIAFRKVGDKGWVIPVAKPRPFMAAAVMGTADQGRRMMVTAAKNALIKDLR